MRKNKIIFLYLSLFIFLLCANSIHADLETQINCGGDLETQVLCFNTYETSNINGSVVITGNGGGSSATTENITSRIIEDTESFFLDIINKIFPTTKTLGMCIIIIIFIIIIFNKELKKSIKKIKIKKYFN